MRTPVVLVLLVSPALLALLPPAAAEVTEEADRLQLLTPPIGGGTRYPVYYRDIAWSPNGAYAMIVGGIRGPNQNPCAGWSFAMLYDGFGFEVLLNQSGCMLTKAAFSPDSSHAILVGERDSILKFDAETKSIRNIWLLSSFAAAGEHFSPRSVAYRPDGSYALITGNDLLRYYEEKDGLSDVLLVAHSGAGDFYDAVAWSPDSRYAIMEAGVTDSEGTRALGMISFLSEDAAMCTKNGASSTPCIYYRGLYGKYDPGFTDIDDITFGLAGRVAWIYGYDGGLGTILRYLEDEDNFDWPGAYEHKKGRISSMAWQPNTYRPWYTAYGDGQFFVSEAWKYRTLLNNTMCKELWPTDFSGGCPSMKEVAWAPSGTAALLISGTGPGRLFRFDPRMTPSVEFNLPIENKDYPPGPLIVRGRALPPRLTNLVDSVEVRIDEGAWTPASLTGRAGSQQLWNVTVDTSSIPAGGRHTAEARASDDDGATWGPVASMDFYLLDATRQHGAPALSAPRGPQVKDGFDLVWTPIAGARYVLQRSAEPTFISPDSIYNDDAAITFPLHKQGQWYFRVAALGGQRQSDWSNVVDVLVGDGPVRGGTGSPDDPNAPSIVPKTEEKDPQIPPATTDKTPATPNGGSADPPQSRIPQPALAAAAAVALAGIALARRRRA